MNGVLSGKSDAQARKITKVFSRVPATVGSSVISDQEKAQVAEGNLKPLLDRVANKKAVRKEVLRAFTEKTSVQLETRQAVVKPPGSTADCQNALDVVSTVAQIAVLEEGESIEYCYNGQKKVALSSNGLSRQNARRRLLAQDCAEAQATLDDGTLIIEAADGCAYVDGSFRLCLENHFCLGGNETSCAPGFNIGLGNVGCNDCQTVESSLRQCSCCTGCTACHLLHHGPERASLALDMRTACSLC